MLSNGVIQILVPQNVVSWNIITPEPKYKIKMIPKKITFSLRDFFHVSKNFCIFKIFYNYLIIYCIALDRNTNGSALPSLRCRMHSKLWNEVNEASERNYEPKRLACIGYPIGTWSYWISSGLNTRYWWAPCIWAKVTIWWFWVFHRKCILFVQSKL